MWDTLLKSICDLTQKMSELLDEVRAGSRPGTRFGGRIAASIAAVVKQGSNPVKIANANGARLGVIVQNQSEGELMLALDEDRIATNYYTFRLKPGETLHMDERMFAELYKGGLMGLWDEAASKSSKALVTEIYWTQ